MVSVETWCVCRSSAVLNGLQDRNAMQESALSYPNIAVILTAYQWADPSLGLSKCVVPRDRIELPTLRFSVACSTN